MNTIEIFKVINEGTLLLLPVVVVLWLIIIGREQKHLRDIFWANQFEVKDILRDIKANTIRNRELLIGDEVYDVDEIRK